MSHQLVAARARRFALDADGAAPAWLDNDRRFGTARALPTWHRRDRAKDAFRPVARKDLKKAFPDTFGVAHVVRTRFQLEEEHLATLLEARLELFFALALPSMASQTTTNFAWLIYARVSRWPKALADRLRAAVAPYAHFYVVEDLPEPSERTKKALVAEALAAPRHHRPGKRRLAEPRAASPETTGLDVDFPEAAMPRDFDACELLAHVGRPCGPSTKFRLSTLLDADDALHVDFLLSLQRAAVHELHEAYDAARDAHLVLCAFDTFEWTAKRNEVRLFWRVTQDASDNQFKCLTPGFTQGRKRVRNSQLQRLISRSFSTRFG